MRLFDYIGELFLFRRLFGQSEKNEWQHISDMNVPYLDNNGMYSNCYIDIDDADSFGHEDYDCHEDFLEEQEDYDMMDDYFLVA